MKARRRYAGFVVLAAASVLAGLGIAAAAPDGNSSSLNGSRFAPSKLPKNRYKPGTLFVHTHTDYANPNDAAQGGYVTRTQIWFDDDGRTSPKGIPKCNTNLTGTMAQAMAACGDAKVGSGTAEALAGLNPAVGHIPVCVLTFNGPRHNDHPTVILFSRVGTSDCSDPAHNTTGGGSVVLKGEIKPVRKGDYGSQLDVKHIDAASPQALSDFNTKTHRGSYVSSRCHDRNHRLNIKGKFTYSDGQSDTVHSSQRCRVKHRRR